MIELENAFDFALPPRAAVAMTIVFILNLIDRVNP
jgi:hypothetical protein